MELRYEKSVQAIAGNSGEMALSLAVNDAFIDAFSRTSDRRLDRISYKTDPIIWVRNGPSRFITHRSQLITHFV